MSGMLYSIPVILTGYRIVQIEDEATPLAQTVKSGYYGDTVAGMLGIGTAGPVMTAVCTLIWGIIMLATACFGFKGLKWLNYIAVPLLVIVCIYGVVASFISNDGASVLAAYAPAQSAGLVFGISMTVASFALGGVISADYCRLPRAGGMS